MKVMLGGHKHFITLLVSILLIQIFNPLTAQFLKPTVAVLDFTGVGISATEATSLTGRFATEIAKTGEVRLVERNAMEEILKEQGFQQSGCTSDECVVEVGNLLGVQYMISGSIGKVGATYTIDTRMISIETGESIVTKSIAYQGIIDGLITEIEILAWEMAGKDVPTILIEQREYWKKAVRTTQGVKTKTRFGALSRSIIFPGFGQFYSGKKSWGYLWSVSELALVGTIYLNYQSYHTASDDFDSNYDLYKNETDLALIQDYKSKTDSNLKKMESANDNMKLIAGIAGGVWLLNTVHAYLVGPSGNTYSNETPYPLKVAYDPNLQSALLRLEVPLD